MVDELLIVEFFEIYVDVSICHLLDELSYRQLDVLAPFEHGIRNPECSLFIVLTVEGKKIHEVLCLDGAVWEQSLNHIGIKVLSH